MPGLCVFNDAWLEAKEYRKWLKRDPANKRKGYCSVCKTSIDVSRMGEGALRSHNKGTKHKQRIETQKGVCSIMSFSSESQPEQTVTMTPSTSSGVVGASTSNFFNTSRSQTARSAQHSAQQLQVSGTDVLKAEIIWTLKCISSHYSYMSCSDILPVFKAMFPDSTIAEQFSCGERKCSYLTAFGIGPYLQEQLQKRASASSCIVLLFDETLNKELQEKQLDLFVRFLDDDQLVRTCYLDSHFLGHGRASDLCERLLPVVQRFSQRKVLQLSMDGPNVNLKVQETLQREISQNTGGTKMLNIGTCGLHILHNAFKAGVAATQWELDGFLRSLYYLFHDSPARKEDFQTLAKTSVLPLKFCSHRWLENAGPAERAIELLPHIVAYCSAAKNKTLPEPTSKSFKDILRLIGDPLIKARLHFFVVIARRIEPFLKKYQTDAPMLPFLSIDLGLLVKDLMSRFLKPEFLDTCKSVASLVSVKLSDKENYLDASRIDVGFSANLALRNISISDRSRMSFRVECRDFLLALLNKIIEKAPIKYQLVRSLTWLDPRLMVNNSAEEKTKRDHQLDITLRRLLEAGRVKELDCDTILSQYRSFIDDVLSGDTEPYRNFDPSENRLDELLCPVLAKDKKYALLWGVVQQILVLSHGQATVERGFSVNKETSAVNIKHRSLVARRIILDTIKKVGGPTQIPITKELLCYCSSARHKYQGYLQEEREKKEKEKTAEKRKAETQEAESMKMKKQRLEKDIDCLERSANSKAVEAEQKKKFTLLMESNALRKKIEEKRQELQNLEEKLNPPK